MVFSIRRVSTDADDDEVNGESFAPSISADGHYVAFTSFASDLVPGDINGLEDVFVKDLLTGAITLVSTDASGDQGNSSSAEPSISGDGRYLVFRSGASDLVPGDTNGRYDVFVKDLLTGAITRVSTDASGDQANGDSGQASISDDGRYVAFTSYASNLVPGDTNNVYDVFVKDLLTGAIIRVSTDASGDQGNGDSDWSVISADGLYVAFASKASDLVPGDTNSFQDLFVRNMLTGAIILVSTDASGDQANSVSYDPSISGDGRYVAFTSLASDLVPGDTNGVLDVFVKDLLTGATMLVSTDVSGDQGNFASTAPSISADGRYVAFYSLASDLVPDDTNGVSDVFVKDLLTGVITRVSTDASGDPGNFDSFDPSISGDGRYVAFDSFSTDLVPGDTNNSRDVFVAPSGGAAENVDLMANNLVAEMAQLANEAYDKSTTAALSRNWHVVSAGDLHLDETGNQGGVDYTLIDGVYSATLIKSGAIFGGSANALVLEGYVDGVKTLVLAFRGTDSSSVGDLSHDLTLATDVYFASFLPLLGALGGYIQENGIENILLSGHSLGGSMVQDALATPIAGVSPDMVYGYTWGSPGADLHPQDAQLVNFVHPDDPVVQIGGGLLGRSGLDIAIDSPIAALNTAPFSSPHSGLRLAAHNMDYYLEDTINLATLANDSYISPDIANAIQTGDFWSEEITAFQIMPGTEQSDDVWISSKDQFVLGGSGDDTFHWPGGSVLRWASITPTGDPTTVDGGADTDTLVLPGRQSDWSFITNGAETDLYKRGSPDPVAVLYEVEYLQFAGRRLVQIDQSFALADHNTTVASIVPHQGDQ